MSKNSITNIKIIKISILLVILFLSACGKRNIKTVIKLTDEKLKIDSVLHFDRVYELDCNKLNISGVTKVLDLDSKNFIVLDPYSTSVFLLSKKNGKVNKIIGQGRGPRELTSISDVEINNKGHLFALNVLTSSIKEFDKNLNPVNLFHLSFAHRTATRLYHYNNNFIIPAERNLELNSTSEDYEFLQYSDIFLLNVYNSNFKLIDGFLHPDSRLEFTQGVFLRPEISIASVCIKDNYIFTATEEGFYEISLFDNNFKKIKTFEISDPIWTNFNISQAKEYDFSNRNIKIKDEDIGNLIASHSRIISLMILNNSLIVVKEAPYENYFPMYIKKYKTRKYYMDIFSVDKKFNLLPKFSNIELNSYMPVGVSKNYLILTDGFSTNYQDKLKIVLCNFE